MKIHLRADHVDAQHCHFTVFVNRGNAGKLIMNVDEAADFHQIVGLGCVDGVDEFVSSGEWGTPTTVRNKET